MADGDGELDESEADGGETRVFAVASGAPRLDVWLVEQCPDFSRSRVQGLIKAGRVCVNGVPAERMNCAVRVGDEVTVSFPPPVPAVPKPEPIPLDVIYEDGDLLALNKPAGLVVHPAPGHLTGTLVNALLAHCPALSGIGGVARPGIVHRLDQDTSGVMVVAKSQRAMDVLTKEFASHANLRKTYLAVVHGRPVPQEGRLETLVGRSPFDRKKMAIVERNGKRSVTNWRMLESVDAPSRSLVECVIETGRTHQIRVHLASLGCPIVGDAVYGRVRLDRAVAPPPTRQLLHAWRLELKHPVTRNEMRFEAPVPSDFGQWTFSFGTESRE